MCIGSKRIVQTLAFATLTMTASAASAEDAPAPAPPPPPPAEAADEDKDGVRFRGGVAAGGGALVVAGYAIGLGGIDGRFGVQITDLLGVYVQPQLALGAGSVEVFGASGTIFGGSLGGTALVDFTFIDQIFVGVGGGGGLVQVGSTHAGGTLHFRAGGYPIMGFGEDDIRRKGLMLGADFRLHFAAGETFISPMAYIGYEAF